MERYTSMTVTIFDTYALMIVICIVIVQICLLKMCAASHSRCCFTHTHECISSATVCATHIDCKWKTTIYLLSHKYTSTFDMSRYILWLHCFCFAHSFAVDFICDFVLVVFVHTVMSSNLHIFAQFKTMNNGHTLLRRYGLWIRSIVQLINKMKWMRKT